MIVSYFSITFFELQILPYKQTKQQISMHFLALLPESSNNQPFVIPNLSPVSRPSSRKNSDASVTDLDPLEKSFLINAINSNKIGEQDTQKERRNSLTLL